MIQNSTYIDVIQQAPACFGAISCFARDSEHCQKCAAYSDCEQQSYETLNAIKGVVNVNDLLRQHQKARIAAEARREQLRAEMNPPKTESSAYSQPKRPELVERATKVEKVVFEMTEQDEAIVMTLPVKAQNFAMTLIKSGLIYDIKQGAKEGKNAISGKKPVWMASTVDLLVQGGFTKAQLKAHLIEQLGWADNSAAAHVSLGIAILCGFGIAQEESGRFTVVP